MKVSVQQRADTESLLCEREQIMFEIKILYTYIIQSLVKYRCEGEVGLQHQENICT